MWCCWFRRSIRKGRYSTRNLLRRRNNSRERRYSPSSSPGYHRYRAAQGEAAAGTAAGTACLPAPGAGPEDSTAAGPEELHSIAAGPELRRPGQDAEGGNSRPVEVEGPGCSTAGWTLLLVCSWIACCWLALGSRSDNIEKG